MPASKLRITHITRSIEPVGGCEIYIRNLIAETLNAGHAVQLITSPPGIETIQPAEGFESAFVNHLSSYERKEAMAATSELGHHLERFSPDIVHIHDLNNPFVIRSCGERYPTIKTTLNADAYCGGIDKYHFSSQKACNLKLSFRCLLVAYKEKCMSRHPRRALEIISLKKESLSAIGSINFVVVPSESSRNILLQNGVPKEQIRILPLFLPTVSQTSLDPYPKKTPCILFVGRLRFYKGAHLLLKALAQIKTKCRVVFVGDGEQRAELESVAIKLNLIHQIQFMGNQPHEKIGEFYNEASVIAVPSIYADSFPTVGLEAMAYARPVVAFRIGGIPDWLADKETGYLVEPQDVGGLAEKIESLLADQELAESMGRAGRNIYLNRFASDPHLKMISELYGEAIASSDRLLTSA